ncbi:MAG TPA: PilZ domain-containing protein [Thauera sp.]|jgi:type IV pilus assembly protein PilZ|nr:PilZ domain-containing protein [Thauera sp.]HRA80865.1 PilZ domain-containing protein [Thauera sp.]
MSTHAKPQMARPGVLSLNINSKSALYAAYMAFLNHGGLFVPTPKNYNLGDEVFMLLQLMDDPTRHPVAGRVVWITPHGAQGGKTQGVGVQFADDETGKVLRGRIEQILAGHLGSSRPTHTV